MNRQPENGKVSCKNSKICFISSLYSDGNNFDSPGRFEKIEGHEYFMFTNLANLRSDWNVVNTNGIKEINSVDCNIRKSRYAKFLGWNLLSILGVDCDYVVYCDAYITPNVTNWGDVLKKIDGLDFAFMQRDHPEKSVRNGGIIREAELIIQCGKDSYRSMKKTIDFFQSKFPKVPLQYPQYYENTVFAYKPDCKKFQEITSEFWEIYTNEDISYRDQPLWNLLLLKNNLKPLIDNDFKNNFRENGVMHNGHVYPNKN